MKPAPPVRTIPKPRPLRSLYISDSAPGKKEANSTKLSGRATTLKPSKTPLNKVKFRSSQPGIVRRHTRAALNRNDSTVFRTLTSITAVKQYPQTNSFFVRPPVNVRGVHQKMMERANRLGESVMSKDVYSKILNDTAMKSPAVQSTPKPSGLSMAYITLSNFKKKKASLKKAKSPLPIEKETGQKENNFGAIKAECGRLEKITDSFNERLTAQDDKENVIVSIAKETPARCLSGMEKGKENNISDGTVRHYTLRNVLNHCRAYTIGMTNFEREIDILDSKFESALMGEIDGQFRMKFSDYQKRKSELYREIDLLEEELEKSVSAEANLKSKFKEYLARRRNVLRERTNLHDNLEKFLEESIRNYESKSAKSAACENVQSAGDEQDEKAAEPVLRRSKRLLGTPRGDGICRRESPSRGKPKGRKEEKKTDDEDDSIVKRNGRWRDKRRAQMCLYKDLQKSFNLCSPESSF